MRGAEHGGEVEAVGAQQQRRGGRGQDAAEQRLAAGRRHAGGHRGLEHLAGLARVADDEDAWSARAALAGAGRRGPGERERELRGEELPGDAADAVGPEQLAGHRAAR